MPGKTQDISGITVKENTVLLKIKSDHSLPLYRFLSQVFKTLAHFHTAIEWTNTCGWCVLVGISDSHNLPEIIRILGSFAQAEASSNWDTICILNRPATDCKESNNSEIISVLNKRIAIRMVSFSEQNGGTYLTIRPDDRNEALQMIYNHLFVKQNQN